MMSPSPRRSASSSVLLPFNGVFTFYLLLTALLLVDHCCHALSNGAAGCEEGRAAVSGLHTSQQSTVLTGSLSLDDIEFQINGVALQPGVPFNVDIDTTYNWKLETKGTFFRGFLVRLGRGNGNVDTRYALDTTSDTAKVARTACVEAYEVGGVTHNSNSLKQVEEGVLRVSLPSQNMPLDVTVVIQNRNGYSIYYYSGFTIHANPPSAPSAPSATAPPSTAPRSPTLVPFYPPPTAPAGITDTDTTTSSSSTTSTTTSKPTSTSTTRSPTNSPTSFTVEPFPTGTAPTTSTTSSSTSSTTTAGVAEYLFLRYPSCSAEAPCSVCQGDCDSDDDCAGDLECFQRPQDDTSPVPGCDGIGVAGSDYCYAPQANSLRPRVPECTVDNPCAACEGDCDSNDHCAPGLECLLRGPGELTPILGCSGLGIAGLDYCFDPSGGTASFSEESTVTMPEDGVVVEEEVEETDAGQQEQEQPTDSSTSEVVDNNDTNENEEILWEFGREGEDEGPDLVLRDEPCSKDDQCRKCEGKCQDDKDCADGFACFQRNDTSVVPGCGNSTGFSGVNFCWDPQEAPSTRHYMLRH